MRTTKTIYNFERVAVELAGKAYLVSGTVALIYNGRRGWKPGTITVTDDDCPGSKTTSARPGTELHAVYAMALYAQRHEDMTEAVRRDLYEDGGYFRLFGHYPPVNPDNVDLPQPDRFGRLRLAA